ncbi:hypothetical protein CLV56_0259 [Mumia flava]|uniref:Uncharacterized protein n=1 Tax=Mumia flava TaxID=1348852 RepID=A0A2M9BDL4_9ACTN|nr:hypothetical protein [Mumia flava]PJJ56055.1 hypothetical protein CLV56_0259 [Mumia flava]
MSPSREDDEFERIVAGLELSVPDEDDEPAPARAEPDVFEPRWSDPLEESDADPDDVFVPPEPPPVSVGDRVSRIAWTVLVGGPALLLVLALAGVRLSGPVLAVIALGIVAAFVTLMARRSGTDRGSDPDNGAVV